MGAREKLNDHHIVGSLGVAAVIGGLTGSWVVFAVVAAALVATGVCTGEIRSKPDGRSGNRRQGRQ